MQKRWFRRAASAMLAALIVWGAFQTAPSSAAAETRSAATDGYNILLLMDISGSMWSADRPRKALDAAEMFVRSLFRTAVQGQESNSPMEIAVGVMTFDETTHPVQPIRELREWSDVETIAGAIKGIEYGQDWTPTDLGAAVNNATSELDGRSATRRNAIVLFTDGYTAGLRGTQTDDDHETQEPPQIGELPKEQSDKTDPYLQSRKDLYSGLRNAQEMDCEIYIIGFNHEDKIKPLGQSWIRYISESVKRSGIWTNADGDNVNYLITNDMQEVREFYVNLIAGIAQKGRKPYQPNVATFDGQDFYIVKIDSGVARSTIHILSDAERPSLFDPEWNRVEDTIRDEGSGYETLTLTNPTQGEWKLGPVDADSVKVRYLIMDGVSLRLIPSLAGADNAGAGTVTVTAQFHNEPVDEAFYLRLENSVSCTASSKNGPMGGPPPDGGGYPGGGGFGGPPPGGGPPPDQQMSVDLKYDKNSGGWTGTFKPPFPVGEYLLTASLDSETKQWTRNSAEETLSMPFPWPDKEVSLQVRKSARGHLFSLSNLYFPGWNGMALTGSRVESSDEKIVRAELSDAQGGGFANLVITGVNKGEAKLKVTVTENYSGESRELPVSVHVLPAPFPWWLLPLLLIPLAFFVAWWIRKRKDTNEKKREQEEQERRKEQEARNAEQEEQEKRKEQEARKAEQEARETEEESETEPEPEEPKNQYPEIPDGDTADFISPKTDEPIPVEDNAPSVVEDETPPSVVEDAPSSHHGEVYSPSAVSEADLSGLPMWKPETESSGAAADEPEPEPDDMAADEPEPDDEPETESEPTDTLIGRPDFAEELPGIVLSERPSTPEGSFNVYVTARGCEPIEDETPCPAEEAFPLYDLVMATLNQAEANLYGEEEQTNLTSLRGAVRICQKELKSDEYMLRQKRASIKGSSKGALTYGYGPTKEPLGADRPIFTDETNGTELSVKVHFVKLEKDSIRNQD